MDRTLPKGDISMNCRKCGAEVKDGGPLCRDCEIEEALEKSRQVTADPAPFVVSPQILEKLTAFRKVRQYTCRACGYNGLMGVVRRKFYLLKIITIIFDILAAIVLSVFQQYIWASLFLLVLVFEVFSSRMKLHCPNCDKEFIAK